MKQNMGTVDRAIRTVLALVFAVLYATNVVRGTLGVALIVIAAIFLLTSLVGWCLVYVPLGISTCKTKPAA